MNGFFLVRNYFSFTLFKASETEKRNKTESYKTPINFSLYIVACLLLFCDIKLLLKRTCWKILWKNYVIRLFVCRGNENIQAILACELWNVITLFSFAAKLWVRRGWCHRTAWHKHFFDASLWSWPYKPRKQKNTHTFSMTSYNRPNTNETTFIDGWKRAINFTSTIISMSSLRKAKK